MASRRELEITITCAKDIKNVNWRSGPNKPYAVVWVDPNNKVSTKVDENGDTSPTWDQKLVLNLPGSIDDDTKLYIDVFHFGEEKDTKPFIGWAKLSLTDVIGGDRVTKSLKLKRPSGRPHGKIEFDVAVNEIRQPAPATYGQQYASPYGQPYMGPGYDQSYAPPPATGYGAPAGYNQAYAQAPPSVYGGGAGYDQYGGGYNAPPQYAPPAVHGESHNSQAHKHKKGHNFGGIGTGLAIGALAGAVGGIALAKGVDALEDDIADRAAEKVLDDIYGDDDYY